MSSRRAETKSQSALGSQEVGLQYLKAARAIAFFILNVVQVIQVAQSAMYTAKTLRVRNHK